MNANFFSLLIVFFLVLACNSKTDRKRNIVVIGDSNGASPIGWVVKLDSMMVNDTILNYSISGNTIGFDNNGRESLNALRNINKNLAHADSVVDAIDMVIIALGTNDCKAVFDSVLQTVPHNMTKLIKEVKQFNYKNKEVQKILVVSPPQTGPDSTLIAKYEGMQGRLDYLIPELEKVAENQGCFFLNIRNGMVDEFALLTVDGIHFNDRGYLNIANQLYPMVNDKLE
ncbi:MAG: hypothetical protein JW717_00040 [Marinilabiliaceae bacterium]|nr:hypothetical protein [Marinilabiliaceae bacterium]